jgi:transposase
MARPSRFSPEVRERAVRMVFEHTQDHASQWAAITSIAEKMGCAAETLRSWVRQVERDQGQRPGLTTEERQRLQQLERENVELRRANEILRTAAAYFAQCGARPPSEVTPHYFFDFLPGFLARRWRVEELRADVFLTCRASNSLTSRFPTFRRATTFTRF